MAATLAGVRQALLRMDWQKVSLSVAVRNTVGIVLPLAGGVALGVPGLGMVGALGAMNASYSDNSDPYLLRARRMVAAAVLGAGAVTLGALTATHPWIAIAISAAWAGGAGLLVALDATAADIGVLTLVMLLVFGSVPMSEGQALLHGALALAGGLLQTALSIALWPVRRLEPERRVIGGLYRDLADMAGATITPTDAPPLSAPATEAHRLLSAGGRSIQRERYLALLSQAERIRLSLLGIGRVRTRWKREGAAGAAELDGALASAANVLRGIGTDPGELDPKNLRQIQEASARLRDDGAPADVVHQVNALAGQLRSAADLAASSTLPGRAAFDQREEARPWKLRLGGTVATLRANLTLRSAGFRHALRLGISVLAGELTAEALGSERGYWIPMTIAIVLKPDFTSTFARGLLRLLGTGAGLVLATALFAVLRPGPFAEVALAGTLALVLRGLGPANYGIFTLAISAMIVLLFALTGVPPEEVVIERGYNTAIGGAIALVVYALWPTWERTQVGETVARMLDAYREYFRHVRLAYEGAANEQELDAVRLRARLARSNAEASAERFCSEPGSPPDRIRLIESLLARSHRLVHALMALEAGLARSRPAAARTEFSRWANAVEVTLHSAAGAMRGSDPGRLPELRELHHALTESGDPLVERYALVNVEADRITDSLNAVVELVRDWHAGQSTRAA